MRAPPTGGVTGGEVTGVLPRGTMADHLEVARRGPGLGRTSGMSDVIQDSEGVRPCEIVSVLS